MGSQRVDPAEGSESHIDVGPNCSQRLQISSCLNSETCLSLRPVDAAAREMDRCRPLCKSHDAGHSHDATGRQCDRRPWTPTRTGVPSRLPLHNLLNSCSPVGSLLETSAFELVRQHAPNGLFVTEAKLDGKQLIDHVPQAVAQTYGTATFQLG